MLSKSELRRSLRKSRQDASEYKFFWSDSLLEQCFLFFQPGMVAASYRALGSEVDPSPLDELAENCGCLLALPFLESRSSEMEFRAWNRADPLEQASFGFEQPMPSSSRLTPHVIIVPLTGFDANLNRLGQGAGHYDRYFSSNDSALRLGLAWECQRIAALPVDPWDQPLDALLTENGLISAVHSRISLS